MELTSRRRLLFALAAMAGAAAVGCGRVTPEDSLDMSPLPRDVRDAGRLGARPAPGQGPDGGRAPDAGRRVLDLGPGPEVLIHVPPETADPTPMRLVVTLHGAGGTASAGLAPLLPLADAHRLLLVAPSSHDRTWDAVIGRWGPDVRRLDLALAHVFRSYSVDSNRMATSGFSDGASYALSLGLANADLFTHVVAFSPGFIAPAARVGTPRVYIAHGRADTVLPIDATTRRIVALLGAQDVPTRVQEFDGGHVVPADVAEDAVGWFIG